MPKRLRIDFRSTKPTYELYSNRGCNKRDLITAGFSQELADALLWNSYSKKPMRYTLIRPEEWFWTDRKWWGAIEQPQITAMYEISSGSFTDLGPSEQADLTGAKFIKLFGRKASGNLWLDLDGRKVDIVRYMRGRLIEEGFEMAPAYPECINLLVKNYAAEKFGKDILFMSDPDERQRYSSLSIEAALSEPATIWDEKPDYYFQILNGFRRIKDFDRESMLQTIKIVSAETYSRILNNFWLRQTYLNQMTPPNLPPLIGRKDGRLEFFFVTQNASLLSNFSGFMRDYAIPLDLSVSLIQLSPEVTD